MLIFFSNIKQNNILQQVMTEALFHEVLVEIINKKLKVLTDVLKA